MEWISVEERLPKDNKDVLVINANGCCAVMPYSNKTKTWNNLTPSVKPTSVDTKLLDFWTSNEVTHWMPLPEPPHH